MRRNERRSRGLTDLRGCDTSASPQPTTHPWKLSLGGRLAGPGSWLGARQNESRWLLGPSPCYQEKSTKNLAELGTPPDHEATRVEGLSARAAFEPIEGEPWPDTTATGGMGGGANQRLRLRSKAGAEMRNFGQRARGDRRNFGPSNRVENGGRNAKLRRMGVEN